MSFVDAIKSGFSKYVTFSGRAYRSEYWYWVLFVVIASLVALTLDSAILGYSPSGASDHVYRDRLDPPDHLVLLSRHPGAEPLWSGSYACRLISTAVIRIGPVNLKPPSLD
jgi:hypothetical protein